MVEGFFQSFCFSCLLVTNFVQLVGLVDVENPKSGSIVGNLIMTMLTKVMMMMMVAVLVMMMRRMMLTMVVVTMMM